MASQSPGLVLRLKGVALSSVQFLHHSMFLSLHIRTRNCGQYRLAFMAHYITDAKVSPDNAAYGMACCLTYTIGQNCMECRFKLLTDLFCCSCQGTVPLPSLSKMC